MPNQHPDRDQNEQKRNDEQNKTTSQPDEAAGQSRPIPSQAEGDRETVEQDLRDKGLADDQ